MSKIVCGLVVNGLLFLLLGGLFSESVAAHIIAALDFQGSSVLVGFLLLTGIFCWGELTRED